MARRSGGGGSLTRANGFLNTAVYDIATLPKTGFWIIDASEKLALRNVLNAPDQERQTRDSQLTGFCLIEEKDLFLNPWDDQFN